MDFESTSYDFMGDLFGCQHASGLDSDQLLPELTDGAPGAFEGMVDLMASGGTVASGVSTDQLASLLGVHEGTASMEHSCSSDQVSFCGMYSEAEIDKLHRDMRDCEAAVSSLQKDVHHHENLVSLTDTPRGHDSGDYDSEVDDLKEVQSDLNRAIYELREAQVRLRNAE